MKKVLMSAGLALLLALAARPAVSQQAPKAAETMKPAPGPSAAVLEQWNDIGRKLIAIAEDLPEDKYSYKPNPASRTFLAQLIHAAGSMYFFTDLAQGQKPRYGDDPSLDNLKTKAQVAAFVKKCVEDGAALIKAKGDAGMLETVKVGPDQQMHAISLAFSLIEHSGEHYGQLVVYYRINGMVPPESRPKK
jgi:uncharacterized damage-inducible protein DinB